MNYSKRKQNLKEKASSNSQSLDLKLSVKASLREVCGHRWIRISLPSPGSQRLNIPLRIFSGRTSPSTLLLPSTMDASSLRPRRSSKDIIFLPYSLLSRLNLMHFRHRSMQGRPRVGSHAMPAKAKHSILPQRACQCTSLA